MALRGDRCRPGAQGRRTTATAGSPSTWMEATSDCSSGCAGCSAGGGACSRARCQQTKVNSISKGEPWAARQRIGCAGAHPAPSSASRRLAGPEELIVNDLGCKQRGAKANLCCGSCCEPRHLTKSPEHHVGSNDANVTTAASPSFNCKLPSSTPCTLQQHLYRLCST